MSHKSNLEDNEINLRELFAALWHHKLLIMLFTGLSIFLAGYYALTTEKKFTAQAIFQIQELNDSGFNMTGEIGALASLVGLNNDALASNTETLLERAKGREFIIKMKNEYALESDLFFNTFIPNHIDPLWKSTIKKIVGWQKNDVEKNVIIEDNIIKNFRKNVQFEITKGGAIKIAVTHKEPKIAASYANNFMEEIRQLVENESIAAQEERMSYLSETLADSLQEVEITQKNLKDYARQNSALAQENFISDSLKLDQIRMEKRKVTEIAELLNILKSVIKSSNLDNATYEALRSSNPLVDDIDFRRILGMSETISAWTWPKVETIDAVSTTLRDRIKRLDVSIKNIEENAKIYATSAKDLSKFRRNAKIAEATYTVLIEQVKSQSLAAGFQPETFKVFEYATPPLGPSSPKRNLILALGGMLGVLIGCTLALTNAVQKGVYFTRSMLISDTYADLSLETKTIRRLSRKSFSNVIDLISQRKFLALDEASLKLANKKIIYVVNSGGRITAQNAARLLAIQSAKSGRNVILCDTIDESEKQIKENPEVKNNDLAITKVSNNICVMTTADSASFFTSEKFTLTIKDLTNRFDQVFLYSSNRSANMGLMALSDFKYGLVLMSRLRKTKKLTIKNIISRQPIDLLFYE